MSDFLHDNLSFFSQFSAVTRCSGKPVRHLRYAQGSMAVGTDCFSAFFVGFRTPIALYMCWNTCSRWKNRKLANMTDQNIGASAPSPSSLPWLALTLSLFHNYNVGIELLLPMVFLLGNLMVLFFLRSYSQSLICSIALPFNFVAQNLATLIPVNSSPV